MTRRPLSLLRQLIPHLAAILVLLLCARLAWWQFERADHKQTLLDQWESAPAGALIEYDELAQFAEAAGYGQFDPMRHVLLDNQIRNNRPGVHVFTPLTLENGRLLMVNRGWQAWDRSVTAFPEFATPDSPLMVSGRVSDPPRVGFQLGTAAPLDADRWPNLMTYYDSDLIGEALEVELSDRVLLLDPDHPAHLSGDPWPTVNMGPERHIGYAVQWIGIGTTVLVIWIFLSYRAWQRR